MNKKSLAAIGIALLLGSTIANAHGVRYKRAPVVRVEPIYQIVFLDTPVQTCHREFVERRVSNPSLAGPTVAGAIVGAAIGRQFGDGSGRDALTVIGAVAGSAVANQRAQRRQAGVVTVVREPVDRCATQIRRESRKQVVGYWVDYRHRGRIYRIRSDVHPGSHISVVAG